jgi:phosphopantetheinyl transferase
MEPFLLIESDHTSKYELKALLPFLDDWCKKIIDLPRKKESLLARLLLDKLCKSLGLGSIQKCGFVKNEIGKPYFSNELDLHLSITHSDGYVWVAVSNSPIGIDFEKVNIETKNELEIAFSRSDWKIVSSDVRKTFQYFSLKESYSKMIGTGFTKEPSEINLEILNNNNFYTFLKKNDSMYVFTAIVFHLELNKFLNLYFNSLHLK